VPAPTPMASAKQYVMSLCMACSFGARFIVNNRRQAQFRRSMTPRVSFAVQLERTVGRCIVWSGGK
jgi:hypothetical protein